MRQAGEDVVTEQINPLKKETARLRTFGVLNED